MNCEQYQELLSDLVDGFVSGEDRNRIESHLSGCVACAEVRDDFVAIVGYCREHRGEYDAVRNERALWLRISNTVEAENAGLSRANVPSGASSWFRLMNRSWQLSFGQLAASVAAIVLVVSIATVVGVRQLSSSGSGVQTAGISLGTNNVSLEDRYRQQQQAIAYWKDRVELNKARWSPEMRDTFDRNMTVIDTALNDSIKQLNQNPHDAVSEDILNDALNDKVALLKEFADL
ncbi:MAG TPA: zf-HC2 domain-containing protein [Pyrinomonadaceae bacterium]|nr:zf-HC2 domain-containing protein [Pyrinomonadaceae bacterium]